MVVTEKQALELVAALGDDSDGSVRKSKELVEGLLRHQQQPFSRHTFAPGHITATGVVLSPCGEKILLVHHRRLERWLLPGGHVEATDESLAEAARREVVEETGVLLEGELSAPLVGIDVHGIPPRGAEPYHLHHDLVFGFRARSLECRLSAESPEVVWCALREAAEFGLPGNAVRAAWRAREFFRENPRAGQPGGER